MDEMEEDVVKSVNYHDVNLWKARVTRMTDRKCATAGEGSAHHLNDVSNVTHSSR